MLHADFCPRPSNFQRGARTVFSPARTWFSFFYCKDEILNFPRKVPPTLGKFPKHLKMHVKLTIIQGETCCFTTFFLKILTHEKFSLYSLGTNGLAMIPVMFYLTISAANSILSKILTKTWPRSACRNAINM